MTFPISVVFKRKLNIIIDHQNAALILNYIKEEIVNRKANNIIINEGGVFAKGSTSYWRTSLFQIADKASFTLEYSSKSWFLHYQLDMPKLFIYTGLLSLFFGLFGAIEDGMWWIGFAAFAWLCGFNWIIAYIRHGSLATDLAEAINVFMKHHKTTEI
ncbi:hypothetical protein [Mucilaginibacter phyllosphaerae]